MACLKSLTSYSKGCKKVSGGVSKLWMIAYSDLQYLTGTVSNFKVDATGNMVSEIGLKTGKKFVEVGLIKNTFGVVENYASTPEANSFELTTEITLVVSDISIDSRTFVNNLLEASEVACIIQLRSGKYIAVGLSGYNEVSAIAGGTGVAGADLNGYTITISGLDNELIRLVDPTILTTVLG
ncbi:hypothetical protein [Sphingobacterium sp. 1.A.5]|uniref:hypothetical protein n=1 Tax=Sphingobacterium sp. 1.A.5 TaxID=2044604 RepID=UPI000C0BFBDA|nr:hypothetical protein [Sphingobacterium sp. 1.A.5]